jgi:hypothetical protein
VQATPGSETQCGRGVTMLGRLMNQQRSLLPQIQQRTRESQLPEGG